MIGTLMPLWISKNSLS